MKISRKKIAGCLQYGYDGCSQGLLYPDIFVMPVMSKMAVMAVMAEIPRLSHREYSALPKGCRLRYFGLENASS